MGIGSSPELKSETASLKWSEDRGTIVRTDNIKQCQLYQNGREVTDDG